MNPNENTPLTKKKPKPTPCETCAYYDVIDEDGTLGCVVDTDEDDRWHEKADTRHQCRYYHYHDEYKTVRRQN